MDFLRDLFKSIIRYFYEHFFSVFTRDYFQDFPGSLSKFLLDSLQVSITILHSGIPLEFSFNILSLILTAIPSEIFFFWDFFNDISRDCFQHYPRYFSRDSCKVSLGIPLEFPQEFLHRYLPRFFLVFLTEFLQGFLPRFLKKKFCVSVKESSLDFFRAFSRDFFIDFS